ncbi:MAG: 4Fe-4S dicluster domain-containing protein [Candidatus Pacebacteria bacterium]|nr:4Fe-4S dicluster domain-containing protein [Candidatus Paceibacterota bacterium]
MRGPRVFEDITKGLDRYLANHARFSTVAELIGYSHTLPERHVFEATPPQVIAQNCTGCLECATSCAFNALEFVNRGTDHPRLVAIKANCIGCNACVGVCPPEFNALKVQMR